MFRRILFPCLIFALTAFAADKPNFSGTWHLDESKSDVTHSHVTKKVQQSDSEITINNITLKLDGKTNENGVSAKLDGSGLVIRTKHDKLSVEERWSLSGDGKRLTIVSKASGGPAGANTISQHYSKE
jgi:hypothetical protein